MPLTFEVSGTGFLRHMVRTLVGSLVEIGRGSRPEHDIARLLETPDRQAAGQTAPAQGLLLQRVDYAIPPRTLPTADSLL